MPKITLAVSTLRVLKSANFREITKRNYFYKVATCIKGDWTCVQNRRTFDKTQRVNKHV